MAEAVRKYTRAVKLVPDIEQRVCAPQAVVKQGGRTRSVSRDRASTAVQGVGTGAAISIAEEGDTEEHFSVQLKKNIVERGALFQPKDPAHPCHFQHLPSELLHLLVRYVVGSGVDVRTSNALCEVSAMMYVLNREDELWRSILFRTVGEEIALQRWSEHSVVSWRELYLTTPHLLFDGLYVSKSSYIRHGEAGFQDKNFRPWFTITFYRLMRFYPNGTLLMTTTSESPQSAANLLKEHSTQKFDSNVLVGTWWLEDDEVVGNVKRENEIALPKKTARRGHGEEIPEYRVFRHEFAIRLRFVPRRTHRWGLQWAENICTITYFDGTQSTSDMDAEKDYQSFPPLRFHRVPSYGITYDNKLD